MAVESGSVNGIWPSCSDEISLVKAPLPPRSWITHLQITTRLILAGTSVLAIREWLALLTLWVPILHVVLPY